MHNIFLSIFKKDFDIKLFDIALLQFKQILQNFDMISIIDKSSNILHFYYLNIN